MLTVAAIIIMLIRSCEAAIELFPWIFTFRVSIHAFYENLCYFFMCEFTHRIIYLILCLILTIYHFRMPTDCRSIIIWCAPITEENQTSKGCTTLVSSLGKLIARGYFVEIIDNKECIN